MNKIVWLMVGVFCAGCAMTTVTLAPQQSIVEPRLSNHIFPSQEAIRKLLLGVSREEALALIGRTLTIGYERKESAPDEYLPVTSPNPYRSQQITKGMNVYQVDYYVTRINKADGIISDDELAPLVFEGNKLIGKGWEFLKSKTKN